MGIFTHYVGASRIVTRRIFAKTLHRGIHRAYNVGVAPFKRLFVMHGARRIELFHQVVGMMEILPVAAFVTKAPYDYRRVVLVTFNQ